MIEHDLELDGHHSDVSDPKEYAALAEDASGCAGYGKETAASLATLFEAIRRLSGDNKVVRELAELGQGIADDLMCGMEDTSTRFSLEADRYGPKQI